MQQILGQKNDVHSGWVSRHKSFFLKKYHLARTHVVVAIIGYKKDRKRLIDRKTQETAGKRRKTPKI